MKYVSHAQPPPPSFPQCAPVGCREAIYHGTAPVWLLPHTLFLLEMYFCLKLWFANKLFLLKMSFALGKLLLVRRIFLRFS